MKGMVKEKGDMWCHYSHSQKIESTALKLSHEGCLYSYSRKIRPLVNIRPRSEALQFRENWTIKCFKTPVLNSGRIWLLPQNKLKTGQKNKYVGNGRDKKAFLLPDYRARTCLVPITLCKWGWEGREKWIKKSFKKLPVYFSEQLPPPDSFTIWRCHYSPPRLITAEKRRN